MKMWHLLDAVFTGIRDQSKPFARGNAKRRTDLTNCTCVVHDFRIAGRGREMVIAHIGALGDHQDMIRRLRCDIAKRKAMVRFKNRIVWDFAP